MSHESLIHLLREVAKDEQLESKLANANSYEDLKDVAQENGFELADVRPEQVERTIGVVTGQITEELTDTELELVAGGIDPRQRQPSSIIAILIGFSQEAQSQASS